MGGWVKSFIVLLCFCCFFNFILFYYHWGLSDCGSSYVAYLGSGVVYRGCGGRGAGVGGALSANKTSGSKDFHIMQVQSNAVGPDSQQVLLVRVLVSLYLMNGPHSHRALVLGYVHKGREKRSARSGGVVRKQVATVEKFLPWQTPQIRTEGISILV